MTKTLSQSARQHGIAAVEFALTCVILFSFLFGIMEVARLTFVWNSLTQATSYTARTAATTAFSSSQLDTLRQQAIFVVNASDPMPMTDNITYKNLQVVYLDANQNPVSQSQMPSCQAENLTNCAADPGGTSCVRFVRVRVCQAGSVGNSCIPVPYHPWVSMSAMAGLNINLPWFTAIVPLEATTIPGICP
jgi:hypothetical protein